MITVEIKFGQSYQVDWKKDVNVQQALEAVLAKAPQGTFTFTIQYFGSQLGYLVNMINETYETFTSSDKPFFFWEFKVNDKVSSKGIDNTVLNDGDKVTFLFMPYVSSEIPKESTLHHKFKLKSSLN